MACLYNIKYGCLVCNVGEAREGTDEKGICVVDEDPIPSCDYYESDSTCLGCSADFNADEECTCDED